VTKAANNADDRGGVLADVFPGKGGGGDLTRLTLDAGPPGHREPTVSIEKKEVRPIPTRLFGVQVQSIRSG